jgi:hypothetical protein
MRRKLVLITGIIIVALVMGGWVFYLTSQVGGMYFVVDVVGERFTMFVVDQETIKEALANMNGLNTMHPIGVLDFGDGGFNKPWGWHYKPETVKMTDFSTEVCDAEPHFVEENLDYWVNTVKYYCPWSARIVAASQSIPSDAISKNLAEEQVFGEIAPTIPTWLQNLKFT